MSKPYPNPSTLTEQMMNYVWKMASDMSTVATLLAERVTKTVADQTYLGIKAKAASAATADSATKATQDGNGAVIADTYLRKDAKAASAGTADSATTAASATKSSQDGNGNVIVDTYLRKDEKATSATTADSATNAQTAATANAVAWSGVTGKPTLGALSSKDTVTSDDIASTGIKFGSIA